MSPCAPLWVTTWEGEEWLVLPKVPFPLCPRPMCLSSGTQGVGEAVERSCVERSSGETVLPPPSLPALKGTDASACAATWRKCSPEADEGPKEMISLSLLHPNYVACLNPPSSPRKSRLGLPRNLGGHRNLTRHSLSNPFSNSPGSHRETQMTVLSACANVFRGLGGNRSHVNPVPFPKHHMPSQIGWWGRVVGVTEEGVSNEGKGKVLFSFTQNIPITYRQVNS